MPDPIDRIDKLVQRAAQLIDSGQKDAARQLLAEALALNSQRVDAWFLLAGVTHSVEEEVDCLKRVLALDPHHFRAQMRLTELESPAPSPVLPSKPITSASRPKLRQPNSPARVTGQAARPRQPTAGLKPVRKKSRRKLSPWWLLFGTVGLACGLVWMAVLVRPLRELAFGTATPTLAAQAGADLAAACQRFIDEALRISNKSCSQVGSNKVCYGNNTLQVSLADNASGPFSHQGDVIDAASLKKLSASPLDPKQDEWGIAIFKLLANLPRTAPGQNVTFVVFGNTTLTSAGQDLQAFYFSSEVGRVNCDQVPMDGIAVNLPQGGGVHFAVNGAEVTLLGNAALEAHANESMTVSVLSGSALVSADGVDRYFGAGQQVGVPLGGANGVAASGPPSQPTALAAAAQQAACTLSGIACNPGDIHPVSPQDAQAAIQQAVDPAVTATEPASATPEPFMTFTREATSTRRATVTPFIRKSVTASKTVVGTPTASATPTATETASATSTGTITATSVLTATASATDTRTATATRTPSATFTASATPTNTLVPTATFTATLAPSDTATATATATATDTTVPPSDTPTNAPCDISANSFSSGGTNINLNLQNNMPTSLTISSVTVGWPDIPPSQRLRRMFVGGTRVWNGSDNNPPSHLPGGTGWSGQTSDRQIGAGSSQGLSFEFEDSLQSSGYSVNINFSNGCSVSAGN